MKPFSDRDAGLTQVTSCRPAEPHAEDVPNLDRVERLPDASHWVHHDEADRVSELLVDFLGSARPT